MGTWYRFHSFPPQLTSPHVTFYHPEIPPLAILRGRHICAAQSDPVYFLDSALPPICGGGVARRETPCSHGPSTEPERDRTRLTLIAFLTWLILSSIALQCPPSRKGTPIKPQPPSQRTGRPSYKDTSLTTYTSFAETVYADIIRRRRRQTRKGRTKSRCDRCLRPAWDASSPCCSPHQPTHSTFQVCRPQKEAPAHDLKQISLARAIAR